MSDVLNGVMPTENLIKGTLSAESKLGGTLNTERGFNGDSAYEVAVKNGFEGTETEWLESLAGEDGYTPVKGVDYFDGKSGVYVGSGDMPDNCNVQIDPNGDVVEADVFSNVSNALKGSASGKVVAIKDVSSVQHNVKVKASAATNVNVYGKNLVDDSLKSGTPPNIFFDTKNYSTKHTTLKAGTYTLSAKIRDGVGGRTFLYVLDADNKYVTLHSTAQSTLTFTLTETKTLNFKVYNEKFTDINDLEWAQLECGSATEYEPYIAPVTHPVSADGTDIKSVYPSMTFIPETDGVELSVEYNRDINKAFAELQQVIAQLQTLAVATVPMNEEL